jgi:predicted dithiol-disulfide oxidoreductase (DUF899 family)
MHPNQIVSQDEWLAARRALLAKERRTCARVIASLRNVVRYRG